MHSLSITLLQCCLLVASCPILHECKKKKKPEQHCFGHKHGLFVDIVSFICNVLTRFSWLSLQAWSGFHETHQNWAQPLCQCKAFPLGWSKQSNGIMTCHHPHSPGCRTHIHLGTPAQNLWLHPNFWDGFSFPAAQCIGIAAGIHFRKKIELRTGEVFLNRFATQSSGAEKTGNRQGTFWSWIKHLSQEAMWDHEAGT